MRSLAEAAGIAPEFVFVDKSNRAIADLRRLTRTILATKQQVVLVKGLGWRAGVAALAAKYLSKGQVTYFVTAGDAIGRYERNNHGLVRGVLADVYERVLYHESNGFIGRTPYYVGRAIRMGAPSGITIEGFVSPEIRFSGQASSIRESLGVSNTTIVVGVTGSINWSKRQKYCYGLDLVNASRMVDRNDICFLVVGDGSGLDHLKNLTKDDPRFRFVGRVNHSDLGDYLEAIDVAVIAQTRDETGLLRLTTKLPEYLAAGVPVIMSAVPGVYDYFDQRLHSQPIFPVPINHPRSQRFAADVAAVLSKLSKRDLQERARYAREVALSRFSLDLVAARLVPYLLLETR